MKLSMPLPRTPGGRVYRFSPNEDAHPRHFVIGNVLAEVPLTDASVRRFADEEIGEVRNRHDRRPAE